MFRFAGNVSVLRRFICGVKESFVGNPLIVGSLGIWLTGLVATRYEAPMSAHPLMFRGSYARVEQSQ